MAQESNITSNKLISLIRDKGKQIYGDHKRIVVPKNLLSVRNLKGMGFNKTLIAIPEPGQSSQFSFRGPKGLHAHSHERGKSWVIHKDKHRPEFGKVVKHWFTEGMPAMGHYLKWEMKGKPFLAPELRRQKAVMKATDFKKAAGCACKVLKARAGKKLTPKELALIKRNILKKRMSKKAEAPKIVSKPEGSKKKLHPAILPLAVGGAVAGGVMYKLPGIRSQIRYWAKSRMGKSPNAYYGGEARLPKGVDAYYTDLAKRVATKLRAANIDPSQSRIVVGGIGGSGKTSFSKYLSKELGSSFTEIDPLIRPKDAGKGKYYLRGKDIDKFISDNPIPKGSIYEQQHILTKTKPHQYDVAILVDPKTEVIRKRIIERGRSGYQADFYKYKPFQKTQQYALKSLGGKDIGNVDHIKIRASTSDKPFTEDIVNKRIKSLGFNNKGLDREQRVWTASTGKMPERFAEKTHPLMAPFGGGTVREFLDIPKIWRVSAAAPIAAGGTAVGQHVYNKMKTK